MDTEPGDEYIRRIAAYIRTHEQGLAAAAITRKRRAKPSSDASLLNPLSWFDNGAPSAARPVILPFDPHHLFYLLIRLEALSIDVGSLDVRMDEPARPMNYINIFPDSDKSETLSIASFRSSLSAVSRLSLGAGWWGRPAPLSIDAELKYIYSCFTKLPALSLHKPEAKLITELASQSPNENALPMDAFKSLQTLQCFDIDPRMLLGWDRLAESLWSLTIKNSGLEDVSDIFIGAVLDDQARREGRLADARVRSYSRKLARMTSFHSSRLPESVPEDAEDNDDADSPSEPNRETKSGPRLLPKLKWAFLRHLSLADNSLTFLPPSPLPYLASLTHLDLSSNLLVSVPPGLSSLFNLVSLNLADNMIDSVLGIYTVLGQVLYFNLSKNRLESICGLERLLALERVDLRHNLIEESAEVGRLATLPNITEVWVEGNPLTEIEEGYRIRCFDYFCKEGKSILLDGSPPGFYEKMYLSSSPPEQMSSSRPPSTALTPPVVAVGSPTLTTSSPAQGPSAPSPPSSHASSPQLAAANGKAKRKKNKRIVDLNASDAGSSRHESRVASEAEAKPPRIANPGPIPESALQVMTTAEAGPPSKASAPARTPVSRSLARSRHSRHMTEFAPASNDALDDAASQTGSLRKSTAMSRSAARRARVSASMYHPAGEGQEQGSQFREAEAYRARIEALRSDMGDGWLKVFNQLNSPGVPAPSG